MLANLLDAGVDFGVADFGLVIGDDDAAILAQLELWSDFELGFKRDRLAGVKMHVGDVGLADYFEMVFIGGGAKEARHQFFENILPDVSGEALLDESDGSLAGAEPGELDLALNFGDGALGFLLDINHGDGDFERMLATFK